MLFHLIGTITLTLFCIRDTTQNSTCSNPDLNLNVHTDHIIVTFPRSVGPSEVIINLDMHYSRRCVQDTTRIATRISEGFHCIYAIVVKTKIVHKLKVLKSKTPC